MKKTLSKAIQRFIIQQLACFESPAEVVQACKAEFGVQVTRQMVEHYDPTRGGEAKRLASEHVELFNATRARFLSRIDAQAVSHKAYRLSQLEQIMRHAKRQGNWFLAAQMLEQAAKEMGGLYTNRRRLDVNPREALAKLLGVSVEQLPELGGKKEWEN